MARVGLIGVGDMGSGLARNLMAAGHELTLFDVREEQLKPFVEDGARAAISLTASVLRTCEAKFLPQDT